MTKALSLTTVIAGTMLAPQLILVPVNLYAWALVSGEAGASERDAATTILTAQLVLLAAQVAAGSMHRSGRLSFSWPLALGALLAHVGYLWLFLSSISGAIPATIQPWILREGQVVEWNIALMMPGAFASLLYLSRTVFVDASPLQNRLATLGLLIGIPVLVYVVSTVAQPLLSGQVGVVLAILFGVALLLLFLGSLVRFVDNIVTRYTDDGRTSSHYLVVVIAGIAAPLAGLALNYQIPFPTDLQTPLVYVLAVVNGLILLWRPVGEQHAGIRLFLRGVTFPFIAYFFLVFLPFLPLSLFAVLIGFGFLMLTPLVLGIYQARVTWTEFLLARASLGTPRSVVILVCGLAVMPGYLAVETLLDQRAVNRVLNTLYAPDLEKTGIRVQDAGRAADALVGMRNRKEGAQMPYLAGIYNEVVFGGMVMSDRRIEDGYRLLTGRRMPPAGHGPFGGGRFSRGIPLVPPERDVSVIETVTRSTSPGKTTLALRLQNNLSDTHVMYQTPLDLPEGVFITGLRLKIEDEWVDGRIFDRKTALWVFNKITEVRRDPALLLYHSATRGELRVYPFPQRGIREVELDFTYHPGSKASINLGDQTVILHDGQPGIPGTHGVLIPIDQVNDKAFQREPYLHVIVDFSAEGNIEPAMTAELIGEAGRQLGVSDCLVSGANLELAPPGSNSLIPTDDAATLTRTISNIALEPQGGLWLERALARSIMLSTERAESERLNRVPIFVVIAHSYALADSEVSLAAWTHLVPDSPRWYLYRNRVMQSRLLTPAPGHNPSETDVVALKQGDTLKIVSLRHPRLIDVQPDQPLQVYDPVTRGFSALPDTGLKDTEGTWTTLAQHWLQWRAANTNPARLEAARLQLLELSRESGLMLPVTSYIVVEAASQWEMLKRKEKQAMTSHGALDFEDEVQASEPPWWLLLLCLLAVIGWRRLFPAQFPVNKPQELVVPGDNIPRP